MKQKTQQDFQPEEVKDGMTIFRGTVTKLDGKYHYGIGCYAFELDIGEEKPYKFSIPSKMVNKDVRNLQVGDSAAVIVTDPVVAGWYEYKASNEHLIQRYPSGAFRKGVKKE